MSKSNTPRPFTPEEVLELQELHRLYAMRKFEAEQVKQNTLLVPRGQEVAEELAAIVRLLDTFKTQWISQKLTQLGYADLTKVNIDLMTGAITITP